MKCKVTTGRYLKSSRRILSTAKFFGLTKTKEKVDMDEFKVDKQRQEENIRDLLHVKWKWGVNFHRWVSSG